MLRGPGKPFFFSYFDISSNGFLYCLSHSTCQTCSEKSALHSWNWDLLTSTTVKLRLKLLFWESLVTQAVDSSKCFYWFCCGFESVGSLPVRVSSSYQKPLDGIGNCTQWHLGFLCNFSRKDLRLDCLSSSVNCLFLTVMIASCTSSCKAILPNNCFRGCSNTICSNTAFIQTEGL